MDVRGEGEKPQVFSEVEKTSVSKNLDHFEREKNFAFRTIFMKCKGKMC